jgi:beta-lactamase regulating signal transducer with metallopeptidase domain
MKTDILEFILRSTVIWGALLGYYYLVLHRNDNWRLRRLFLLFAWGAGLLIPLLPALSVAPEMPSVRLLVPEVLSTAQAAPVVAPSEVATGWSVVPILLGGYLLGVAIVLARTLVQGLRVMQWSREGKKTVHGGVSVVRHHAVRSPFAAWGKVFLPAEGLAAELENIALIHETAHLRQRHHYDTILMMIGRIVCWFHPLQWVFSRLLSDLHEYEADAAVTQLVPVRTYGLHLLQSSLAPTGALGLFSSPLKKRITMMTKTKVRQPLRALSLIGLIFLMAILVISCSDLTEEVLIEPDPLEQLEIQDLPIIAPLGEVDDRFDGEQLLQKVYREIRYPAEARSAGMTAAVQVELLVGTEGELIDVLTVNVTPEELPKGEYFVITGYGSDPQDGSSKQNHSILSEEVTRTLETIAPYDVIMEDGAPTAYRLLLAFQFKLEN